MNTVYLVSGPCGCGKTTLVRKLAIKINNSFHVSGDDLYRAFRWKEDIVWEERLRIVWENIVSLTRNALRNNLNVIIDEVVEDELPILIEGLAEFDFELRYILLTSTEQSIRARITERGDIDLVDRALFLRNKMISKEDNLPYIYDNSEKSPDEEVDDFLDNPRFLYNIRVPHPGVMPTHIEGNKPEAVCFEKKL
jgi:cytidylate kinase